MRKMFHRVFKIFEKPKQHISKRFLSPDKVMVSESTNIVILLEFKKLWEKCLEEPMGGSWGGQISEKLYFDKSTDKVLNSPVNVQNMLP